jgi:hypothetical protein
MFSTVDPRAVAELHWAVILDRPPVAGLGHWSLDLEHLRCWAREDSCRPEAYSRLLASGGTLAPDLDRFRRSPRQLPPTTWARIALNWVGAAALEFATEDPEPISSHRRQGVDGMSRPLGYTEATRRCGHSAGIGVAQ